MRARSVAAGTMFLALAMAPSASADTGLSVGPARDYMSTEGPTLIQVANAGDAPARITPEAMVYTGGAWEPLLIGLTTQPPRGFRLNPGEQREVKVTSSLPITAPCALYGIRFSTVAARGEGIVARASVLAQLLLRDEGASEADCAAVIPAPSVLEPTGSNHNWWGLLAIPLVLLTALGLVWQKHPPKPKLGRAVGFGS